MTLTCLLVDPEHFSKSDCRFYKRAEVHRGGSWALQRSWWRSWLFFSRSLRAECWGSICCLSIPKHNRIFMKAISTCLNRNDFDLTIIYISIWVARAQWELPYILCVSQEWMWGEAANITVSKKLPFKYSITVFVMILSSVQFQEKDFLLQKQTIQKCFILNFFFPYLALQWFMRTFYPPLFLSRTTKLCSTLMGCYEIICLELNLELPWIVFVFQFSKLTVQHCDTFKKSHVKIIGWERE